MRDLANSEKLEFFSNFVIGTTNMGSGHLEAVSNADGDDADTDLGEEDTTEVSGDDMDALAPEEQYLEVKLRQLIREKKLAMKAQYGKGSLELTHQKCVKVFKKNICAPIPTIPPIRKRGWRYYWKNFKHSGGKNQLKEMAKGLIPYVAPAQQQGNTILPLTITTVPQAVQTPVFTVPVPVINLPATPTSPTHTEIPNPVDKTTDAKAVEKTDTTEQKYLGMSTSIGLPILIAGILVLGVGTIFAIKYFRKGKAAKVA